MDKSNRVMEEELPQKEIQGILQNKNLDFYRKKVNRLAVELEVDVLDYAAALSCFIEQGSDPGNSSVAQCNEKIATEKVELDSPPIMKMVRYRLEVGRKHQVSVQDVKKVLVEEAGVENSRVGYIDLQNYYCIVSLPSGMPTDIFFHLKKVSINQQELKIIRLGGKNRNSRRKVKQRSGRKNFHNMNKEKNDCESG